MEISNRKVTSTRLTRELAAALYINDVSVTQRRQDVSGAAIRGQRVCGAVQSDDRRRHSTETRLRRRTRRNTAGIDGMSSISVS